MFDIIWFGYGLTSGVVLMGAGFTVVLVPMFAFKAVRAI